MEINDFLNFLFLQFAHKISPSEGKPIHWKFVYLQV
jgi:hypothetical protein